MSTQSNASLAAAPAEPPRSGRLGFLDPIRVWLTLLVIAHHASITYGGGGDWYYEEDGSPMWLRLVLTVFTGTNQSFFMGYFFLLAGYFTPMSLARKGTWRFMLERLWRLGVPLLLYAALLSPLTLALAATLRGDAPFVAALWKYLPPAYFDPGPLWFCIALLGFASLWAIVSALPNIRWPRITLGPHVAVALAVLGCGALAFALRLVVPVGRNVFYLQLGYFASYVLLFFGGCLLAPGGALERVSWRFARPWVAVSVAVFPTLWLYAVLGGMFDDESWRGGWHLAAAAYAFWEPAVAAGVILGSLVFFRYAMSNPGPFWRRMADNAFTAFVIHPPAVVAACGMVQALASDPLARFLLAAPLACALAFALADGWRRLWATVVAALRGDLAAKGFRR